MVEDMKKLDKLTSEERREFSELLYAWLNNYTDEVITKVLPRAEEIYNDKMAMHLLREYKARKDIETKKALSDFEFYIREVADNSFESSLIHCNPLEHSKSYKDVLYDLYISDKY